MGEYLQKGRNYRLRKHKRRYYNHFRRNKTGAGDGVRTRDIQLGKLTLRIVYALYIKRLRRFKNWLGVMLGGAGETK